MLAYIHMCSGAGDFSDSEAEDGGGTASTENQVTLPQSYPGAANSARSRTAVRLRELGPRLRLRLNKIEEGFFGGEVLFHEYSFE